MVNLLLYSKLEEKQGRFGGRGPVDGFTYIFIGYCFVLFWFGWLVCFFLSFVLSFLLFFFVGVFWVFFLGEGGGGGGGGGVSFCCLSV